MAGRDGTQLSKVKTKQGGYSLTWQKANGAIQRCNELPFIVRADREAMGWQFSLHYDGLFVGGGFGFTAQDCRDLAVELTKAEG